MREESPRIICHLMVAGSDPNFSTVVHILALYHFIKLKSPTPKERWVSRATQVSDIKLYHARYIEGLWISC